MTIGASPHLVRKSEPKRILLTTIGSLGDLHPCLSLACALRQRGHAVTIATTGYYRRHVEQAGIAFRPLRPDWNPTDSAMIRQCEDLKRGPEILFRKIILPHLPDTYADLLVAAADADLMIAGELNYAAPLVAEKLNLPWVSVILSPCSFFSAHDPSLLVNAPGLIRLRTAGWLVNRSILTFGALISRHWWEPVRQLRRSQGLRKRCDPMFHDKFSPGLVLALFSRVHAQPQPDWPSQTRQPGFVFYDRPDPDSPATPELEEFLAAGDAPIVFTQGSTAVHHPGKFYETSVRAAARLDRRIVLLGTDDFPQIRTRGVCALPYAPYSRIFPRAAIIVHQGGSGTTGQALRAGRPALIVPFGWDQPDNAIRVERLGAGIHLPRERYTLESAVTALQRLLTEPAFAKRAERAASSLNDENGLATACDAIEQTLSRIS